MREHRLLYVLVCCLFLLSGSAFATDYYTTQTGGSFNWTDNTIWHVGTPSGLIAAPGAYPGSAAGDTANLGGGGYSVSVDTTISQTNAVGLSMNCGCTVAVPSGSVLSTTGTSTVGSGSILSIGGGTLANYGTLDLSGSGSGGRIDWSAGTLGGTGTTNVNKAFTSGARIYANGPGTMAIDQQTVNVNNAFYYVDGVLRVDDAAHVNVNNNGAFDVQNFNGILTNDPTNASINVNAGGLFEKTAGNFGTNIDVPVNNDGVVRVDISTLVLGRGIGTGDFNMNGVGTGFAFGDYQFSGTPSISGTGEAFILGPMTVNAGANLSVTNIRDDSFAATYGTGTMTITGTFNWHGGTYDGVTIDMATGSFVNYLADGNGTLTNNAHLNNSGTMSVATGAGSIAINSGAHITNASGGTIDLVGDITINSDGVGGARIDNLSTITKSSGSGSAVIHSAYNNGATTNINSGTLVLAGGGSHTGTFTIPAAATLDLLGNTHTANGAAFNGLGTTIFDGATILVTASGATVSTALVMKSGAINATGILSMSGSSFQWSGGSIGGAGQVVLSASTASTFDAALAAISISGGTLTNNGAITYAPTTANRLSVDSGGKLTNAGTFTIAGDFDIDGDTNAGTLIANNSTLTKSAGAGFAHVAAPLDNSGTINVSSGELALNGGGTNSGTISLPNATNVLAIQSNTYTFTTGITAPSLGIVRVETGGVLQIGSAMTLHKVELSDGSSITGSDLTIDQSFLWQGGSLIGPGTTTLAVGATGSSVGGTGTLTLSNRTFNNGGAFTHDAASHDLLLDAGSTFANLAGASFDFQGGGTIQNGSGSNAFTNAGTFTKSSGANAATIDVAYANSGTTSSDAAGGRILFTAGGSNSGTLSTSVSTAALEFSNGTFTLTNDITGPGSTVVSGADLVAASAVNATNVDLSAGFITINGPTFTVTAFDWGTGVVRGSGALVVNGAANVSGQPSTAGTVVVKFFGNVTYTTDPVNYLTIGAGTGVRVESSSVLTMNGSGSIEGTGTLTVIGSLVKAGSSVAFINTPINTSAAGSISAPAGTLTLTGGGTIANLMDTGASGRLVFDVGTFDWNSGVSASSNALIQIAGGTVNSNAPITIHYLDMTGGTLGGTNNVTLQGGSWTGGDIIGAGSLSILSGATFDIGAGSPRLLGRTTSNAGTITLQTGGNDLTLADNIVLTTSGLFQILDDSGINCVCSGTPGAIVNSGTFEKTGGTLESLLTVTFNNDGITNGNSGTLFLDGGGTHTGSFHVASGATIHFCGNDETLTASSSVSGTGFILFSATTATVAGSYTLTGSGETQLLGGLVNFNTTATSPSLLLDYGTMAGSGSFTINGATTSEWRGGTIALPFTIASGATLDVNGATLPMVLDAATLTVDGTLTYTSTTNELTLDNGGKIVNDPSGTFALTTDAAINAGSSTSVTAAGAAAAVIVIPLTDSITNNGTTLKSGGSGTQTIAPTFTNVAGSVTLQSGTVSFSNVYTQSGGTTSLAGGDVAVPSGMTLNGGTLTGNGTITGDVTNNSASVLPGASPGTITIAGNYTQGSAGTLGIELGGLSPGTEYDQLIVTGTPSLDGTLDVTLINGFVPADGNTFDILTYSTPPSTDFATKNLPTFGTNGTFSTNIGPTSYQLIAAAPVADVSSSQSTSGPAHTGDAVTFTITVTNSGSDPAANAAVTVTYNGPATFTSATPGAGSCSGTGPITCNFGTLNSGSSVTLTLVLTATGPGTISTSATAGTTTPQTSTANDGSNASVAVSASADIALAITDAADPADAGSSTSYTITVTNNGPDASGSVSMPITLTNGTIVSAGGALFNCSGSATAQTCTATSLPAGSTTVTVNVTAPVSGTMSLSASETSSTFDPNSGNNSASQTTTITAVADLAITKNGPANSSAQQQIVYTINVTNDGPSSAANVVVNDPPQPHLTFVSNSGACTTPFPCNLGTLTAGQTKTITSTWMVDLAASGQTVFNTATVSSTTNDPASNNNSSSASTSIAACDTVPPQLIAPADGASIDDPVTFEWSAVDGATSYDVVVYDPQPHVIGTTSGTTLTATIDPKTIGWFVTTSVEGCGVLASTPRTFSTCTKLDKPLARVVGLATTGQSYDVEWDAVPGANRYEVDEASNPSFDDATTFTTTTLAQTFQHSVTTATGFYYRVRALGDCAPSDNSPVVRAVIIPLPPKGQQNPSVNVPAGSHQPVVQQLFIPGDPGITYTFTATTDRPWLTVTPKSGLLTPDGVTLDMLLDPSELPNGTFTGDVILSLVPLSGSGIARNDTKAKTTPVSINLVTPVSPVQSKGTPPANALIIPSVGHLDGINSHWQSDIRVTNTFAVPRKYALTFTPTGGIADGVKQTIITVDPGATTALEDIVKNWYGVGALGDSGNGMLEIRPLETTDTSKLAAIASSRTYNVTSTGTLGQYIPALPFGGFVGKAAANGVPAVLSLQQIAQSAAYRTNVGLVEAAGSPASVLLTAYDKLGTKLFDLPVELKAGEQKQLNSLLAQHNVTIDDGRIEVKVTDGGGKITAYASVVDNTSLDPLLVTGVPLAQQGASRYVVPGVADLVNPLANWRTDLRIFNAGSLPQATKLTFYPSGGGTPISADVTVGSGEIKTLDGVLATLFNTANTGGAVHVDTATPANLIVSGRTFNQTVNAGTFGQFIPAVTAADAVGTDERALHIQQVEDSPRYRTNLGLAEISGKPARVEVQIVLPDSKVTPSIQLSLAANEFRQFRIIGDLGLGDVYNARLVIRVISGEGRVAAYGSVIDMQTQDPTYVPAQ